MKLKSLEIKGTKKQTKMFIFRISEEALSNLKKLSKNCKSISQYLNLLFSNDNIEK